MLEGSGKYVSSSDPTTPEPNCICITPFEVNLVTNLLGTLFSFSIDGTSELSLAAFCSSSNIVSCPRNGTSVHVLPSLSVTSNTFNILSSVMLIVANFSAVVKVLSVDFISPDIAKALLVRRYSAGLLSSSTDAIEMSVGS